MLPPLPLPLPFPAPLPATKIRQPLSPPRDLDPRPRPQLGESPPFPRERFERWRRRGAGMGAKGTCFLASFLFPLFLSKIRRRRKSRRGKRREVRPTTAQFVLVDFLARGREEEGFFIPSLFCLRSSFLIAAAAAAAVRADSRRVPHLLILRGNFSEDSIPRHKKEKMGESSSSSFIPPPPPRRRPGRNEPPSPRALLPLGGLLFPSLASLFLFLLERREGVEETRRERRRRRKRKKRPLLSTP